MELKNDYTGIDPFLVKLIRHKARRASRNPALVDRDVQDLEQELFAWVLEHQHRYDPGKSKRETFFRRLIRAKICLLIRDRQRMKRRSDTADLSLDCLVPDEEGEWVPFHETLDGEPIAERLGRQSANSASTMQMAVDVRIAMESLCPKLKRLCSLLIDHGPSAAAQQLGISRATVYRRMNEIREAFAALGLDQYLGAL